MVGLLAKHREGWIKRGVSNVVLNWIDNGVNMVFKELPPTYSKNNTLAALQQKIFVSKKVSALVSIGAVRVVKNKPHVISPLNVVPKEGEEQWRLVCNMRFINKYLKIPKFKLERIQNLTSMLRLGDWMFTFDDVAGYHHVEMMEEFRKYLGFE